MENKILFQIGILGFACLIVGSLVGVQVTNQLLESSAEQTLSAYPVDLSMAGLHRHDLRNIPEENAPEVNLSVERDSMMPGHFNLEINTENFEFAPENVSDDFSMGEGHAHVYVDAVKISRAYDNYYHLPRLDPGEHRITVTLNTNNHQEYAVNGELISDYETVRVSKDAEMNMSE
jgi:hypothetical protein